MAFHDTKKNNCYHSLFIKLFGHVYGGRFFPVTVYESYGLYCRKYGSFYYLSEFSFYASCWWLSLAYLYSSRLRKKILTLRNTHPLQFIGLQCESKNPPSVFVHFFPNGWEFFNQFLHTYYTFLSTLEYRFLFKYLQLWRSYAAVIATTQRIFTFH